MGKSLVIKGADFSDVAVPVMIAKTRYLVVGANNQTAALRQNQTSRSTLIVYSQALDNQLWAIEGNYTPPSDRNHYALNPIPSYATKVKVTAGIKLSICLFTTDYKGCLNPVWSGDDGVQQLLLSSYPTAAFFSVNVQSETVNLENVTIEFV